MNMQAIRILFLKDLFLSRRFLFAYFAGALAATAITCAPNETVSFVGFILILTVAIAAGIHFIGLLMLGETTDQTRLFVMSLPVSLLDYSISKMSVVLTVFLIPWTAMFAGSVIATFAFPWGKEGSIVVLPVIFLFLLSGFTVQLATAVISESVGWTISVMVAGNVLLNVFLTTLYRMPDVAAVTKGSVVTWPPVVLQIVAVESLVIAVALGVAFIFQTRKRDLIK